MSDPVTNVEIEDVLSSIRRLVSEDARSARPRQEGQGHAPDRLVLTPSLRVHDEAPKPAAPRPAQPAPWREAAAEPAARPVLLTNPAAVDPREGSRQAPEAPAVETSEEEAEAPFLEVSEDDGAEAAEAPFVALDNDEAPFVDVAEEQGSVTPFTASPAHWARISPFAAQQAAKTPEAVPWRGPEAAAQVSDADDGSEPTEAREAAEAPDAVEGSEPAEAGEIAEAPSDAASEAVKIDAEAFFEAAVPDDDSAATDAAEEAFLARVSRAEGGGKPAATAPDDAASPRPGASGALARLVGEEVARAFAEAREDDGEQAEAAPVEPEADEAPQAMQRDADIARAIMAQTSPEPEMSWKTGAAEASPMPEARSAEATVPWEDEEAETAEAEALWRDAQAATPEAAPDVAEAPDAPAAPRRPLTLHEVFAAASRELDEIDTPTESAPAEAAPADPAQDLAEPAFLRGIAEAEDLEDEISIEDVIAGRSAASGSAPEPAPEAGADRSLESKIAALAALVNRSRNAGAEAEPLAQDRATFVRRRRDPVEADSAAAPGAEETAASPAMHGGAEVTLTDAASGAGAGAEAMESSGAFFHAFRDSGASDEAAERPGLRNEATEQAEAPSDAAGQPEAPAEVAEQAESSAHAAGQVEAPAEAATRPEAPAEPAEDPEALAEDFDIAAHAAMARAVEDMEAEVFDPVEARRAIEAEPYAPAHPAPADADTLDFYRHGGGALSAHNDLAGIDEEMLRQMVSDIVRQELQGVLGERITRNVRKLVRREIHRVVMSQEFD